MEKGVPGEGEAPAEPEQTAQQEFRPPGLGVFININAGINKRACRFRSNGMNSVLRIMDCHLGKERVLSG